MHSSKIFDLSPLIEILNTYVGAIILFLHTAKCLSGRDSV